MSRCHATACAWLAAIAGVAGGCTKEGGGQGGQGQQGPGGAPVPVTVATAETRNVPIEITGIGNVQAASTVTVHPQVSGSLMRAPFREGQTVRQGQILFQIDPQPYEAARTSCTSGRPSSRRRCAGSAGSGTSTATCRSRARSSR